MKIPDMYMRYTMWSVTYSTDQVRHGQYVMMETCPSNNLSWWIIHKRFEHTKMCYIQLNLH